MSNTVYCEMTTELGEKVEWFISNRRRYGPTTQTWVHYKVDGKDNEDYFDPWPAINYPKSQLVWMARCQGLSVTPSKADIRWAKRMATERRFFQMDPLDREAFLPPPTETLAEMLS